MRTLLSLGLLAFLAACQAPAGNKTGNENRHTGGTVVSALPDPAPLIGSISKPAGSYANVGALINALGLDAERLSDAATLRHVR